VVADLNRLAAGVLMVGFPGKMVPEETRDLLRSGVRNVILFARNLGAEEEVRRLTHELRQLGGDDMLIGIDHEGGRVNRFSQVATRWPSPMAWVATDDVALARRASEISARELSALGINLNFAPVTDLLADHRNPVLGVRCFSDDPVTAAHFAAAFVEGHLAASVGTTAKHFPGHGSTPVDSHVDLPRVDRSLPELQAMDLVPFTAALAAGADGVMISHVWFPHLDAEPLPASLSRTIGALARDVMGPDGLMVTDCMEMGAIQRHVGTGEAVVRAVESGADLVLVSHRVDRQREALDALVAAAETGRIPQQRLEDSNRRLAEVRGRNHVSPGPLPREGEAMAREIALRAITLVRDERAVLPLNLRPDEPLGVVTFAPGQATSVEGRRAQTPGMLGAARTHHNNVVEVVAGDEDTERVLSALAGVDTVLVGTSFATGRPWQAALVRAILEYGKSLVVLALADPFDLLAFPEAPAYLAVYGEEPFLLEAAIDVLFGTAPPSGRLPVGLPGLYPRGWCERATPAAALGAGDEVVR
jgi:beta-N-acetylhexosaminidase